MNSNRPYLLRGLFEWIVDNDCTPYVVVAADVDGVDVPQAYVADGRIVLNIAPAAVRDLVIADQFLSFTGRFSGQSYHVSAPIGAVTAIYAKESGEGMMFQVEEGSGLALGDMGNARIDIVADSNVSDVVPESGREQPAEQVKAASRPMLRVVK